MVNLPSADSHWSRKEEEGVENQEPGKRVQVSVSAQLRLVVRKVVCVESQPPHPGPHHPAPVMAHKGDLVTEAVNAEMLHQEDHALQVQVRSRSNFLKSTYLSLEVGHYFSVVRTQPGAPRE